MSVIGVEEQRLSPHRTSGPVGSAPIPAAAHRIPHEPAAQADPQELLQHAEQRIGQLAERLDRLQASLDLWTKSSDAMAPTGPSSAQTRAGGSSTLRLGVFLVVIASAVGMLLRAYREGLVATLGERRPPPPEHAAVFEEPAQPSPEMWLPASAPAPAPAVTTPSPLASSWVERVMEERGGP